MPLEIRQMPCPCGSSAPPIPDPDRGENRYAPTLCPDCSRKIEDDVQLTSADGAYRYVIESEDGPHNRLAVREALKRLCETSTERSFTAAQVQAALAEPRPKVATVDRILYLLVCDGYGMDVAVFDLHTRRRYGFYAAPAVRSEP